MCLLIAIDDPRTEDVRSLLATHLAFANEVTPAEDVHALGLDGLLDESITFFSARRDGMLLGVGALRHLDDSHVELKSMHTAKSARGQGIGKAIVEHVVRFAIEKNYERMSLETGTMAAFKPARELYARLGFDSCEPFGDYSLKSGSMCMTLTLND